MKNTFTLLISLFLLTGTWSVVAQDAIMDFSFNMREETRQMSRKSANSFILNWPQGATDQLEKSWKRYAKKLGGKLNYDRNTGESFLDNATVEGFENAVDITTKTAKVGEGAEMTFWVNGGVTYIESSAHPEAFVAVEKLLRDFDTSVYAELMRAQIKVKEKELKKIERDTRKVEKAIAKEQKRIEKAEKTIAKAQQSIDASRDIIGKREDTLANQEAKEEYHKQLIEKMQEKIKAVR